MALGNLTTLALALAVSAAAAAAPPASWVEAWYAPPFPPTATLAFNDVRTFAHQTVRQVVRVETAGKRLRVRLTNELGLAPVRIGSVHVALSSPNGVTEPQTDHLLTFGGRAEASIPIGRALLSDPVDMPVAAFTDLAISIYYPRSLAPSGHLTQVHISPRGDHGAEPVWPRAASARAPALASAVEVQGGAPRRVLVAFGDSITEGAGSTPGTNQDWPQQLAVRLAQSPVGKGWVVINSGIGGNRLLHDGAGPKALDRFDRDALDISGVRAVIVHEGINDIGWAYDPDGDSGPVRAADIIGAYQQLIARAHARGLKIFGGTILPYEEAVYYHPQGETVRQAVNVWIRTSGAFDGVIDFDQAVRDPRHTARFLGADQCGDNLHPNDAGYRAMSEAVDLKLLQ